MVECPYCMRDAELVTGKEIYPHRSDLHSKKFWLCRPCDAYVGCHSYNKRHGYKGNEPLGRLANRELRIAKMAAHAAFDPIWKNGKLSRDEAYAWLATQLNISLKHCHIGMFDEATCRRVVATCSKIN